MATGPLNPLENLPADATPSRANPAGFGVAAELFVAWLGRIILALNAFVAQVNDMLDDMVASTYATSTTSLAVGIGSKSLTCSAARGFYVGRYVRIARTSAPDTTYMEGLVTSYNASTGALVVQVAASAGSGTYTDWTVAMRSQSRMGWGNMLLNGCMSVWQRATSDTGVTTAIKYVADRWFVYTAAGTLANVQRVAAPAGSRSEYAMRLDGASGVTQVGLAQRIEARGLRTGVVTFQAKITNNTPAAFTPLLMLSTPNAVDDWTGSAFRNNGGAGDSLQSCPAGQTTLVTWTADVSGYTNVANGLAVYLIIPTGPLSAAGQYVLITDVALDPNPAPADFERRPLAVETRLCQRYYWKSAIHMQGYGTAGGSIQMFQRYPEPMRAAPTCAVSGQSYNNSSNMTLGTPTTELVGVILNVTAAASAYATATLTASAEL